jgi:hypothetical protein
VFSFVNNHNVFSCVNNHNVFSFVNNQTMLSAGLIGQLNNFLDNLNFDLGCPNDY